MVRYPGQRTADWSVTLVVALGLVVGSGCFDPPDRDGDATGDAGSVDAGGDVYTGDTQGDARTGDVSRDGLAGDTVGGTDSGTDTGGDAGPAANRCGSEVRKLVNASGPEPEVREVPWKMIAGGSPNYRKKTVTAVWKGTRQLETPVTFDCPTRAQQAGLKCRTARGLVFEHAATGVTRTLLFAVALPLGQIDWPDEGTRVELTYYREARFSTLEVRDASSREPILSLRAAPSDGARGRDRAKPQEFVNEYEMFQIRMEADISEPETAYCLALDHCDRLLRIEPLTIASTSKTTVSPGSRAEFSIDAKTYAFWHLVSFRRNQDLGPESRCSDVTQPASSYAFARLE